MALSPDEKQRIVELLAQKWTAAKIAADIGCSARTVARVAKLPKNDKVVTIARKAIAAKTLDEQSSVIVETLQVMIEREPAMQQQIWRMFTGLSTLFNSVLEQTNAEDVSPRQLPALAKAVMEIAATYSDFSDRIHGVQILADEVQQLSKDRAA